MKFTERIGLTPVKTNLEKTGISIELRNSLWTVILEKIINFRSNQLPYNLKGKYGIYTELAEYYRQVWIHFLKLPIDNLIIFNGSLIGNESLNYLRNWYFNAHWGDVLNFIEFSERFHPDFANACNIFLKNEFSAYRFVNGLLVEVNSKEEIIEIENAIRNSDKFKSVKTHLETALNLLSQREKPDFRNSIKESISSVEALSKIIISDSKTTLGQALKIIEIKHKIPNSLKSAFNSLYGFTSDEGGIRHSLLENDVKIEMEEARFMLVTCSAFVNYLINKL